jgi:hypothetical protein
VIPLTTRSFYLPSQGVFILDFRAVKNEHEEKEPMNETIGPDPDSNWRPLQNPFGIERGRVGVIPFTTRSYSPLYKVYLCESFGMQKNA